MRRAVGRSTVTMSVEAFEKLCAAGVAKGDVLGTVTDRMHNDLETERKVIRNELAKINRTRLERMLGPEGGYQNC
jgi:hypothetical protein